MEPTSDAPGSVVEEVDWTALPQPAMPSDSSARAQSLQLIKKKLGAAATRRGKGSTAGVQPPPPPPLPECPMDPVTRQTEDTQRIAGGRDSRSGHENPATDQDGEETQAHGSEDIPIAALRQQQPLVMVERRGGKRPPSEIIRSVSSCSSADTTGDGLVSGHFQPSGEPRVVYKTVIKWSCRTCQRECIPIREESRCLCGHRYKEHPSSASDPRVKDAKRFRAFACTSSRCSCPLFFYVVAEGAWVLRCRCKHKHVEHDASLGAPFACKKPKCSCVAFDSPWVCNCDHPWSDHAQEVATKQLRHPLALLEPLQSLDDLSAVRRTDLVSEPLHLRL